MHSPDSFLVLPLVLGDEVVHFVHICPVLPAPPFHLLLGPHPGLGVVRDVLVVDSLVLVPVQLLDLLVVLLIVGIQVLSAGLLVGLVLGDGDLSGVLDALLLLFGLL